MRGGAVAGYSGDCGESRSRLKAGLQPGLAAPQEIFADREGFEG